jgi:hypothetical protein
MKAEDCLRSHFRGTSWSIPSTIWVRRQNSSRKLSYSSELGISFKSDAGLGLERRVKCESCEGDSPQSCPVACLCILEAPPSPVGTLGIATLGEAEFRVWALSRPQRWALKPQKGHSWVSQLEREARISSAFLHSKLESTGREQNPVIFAKAESFLILAYLGLTRALKDVKEFTSKWMKGWVWPGWGPVR